MGAPLTMGWTGRLARYAARRPWRIMGIWGIAVLLALVLAGTMLHNLTSSSSATGSTPSSRAAAALARAFPNPASRTTDVVLVSSPSLTAATPRFRAAVGQLEERIRATAGVRGANSYLDGAPGLVSADGHSALIELAVATDTDVKRVVALVTAANGRGGFATAITGDHSVANDFNTLPQRDLSHAELAFGLPAALVVLVLVFGSLVAGLIPVLMAILSIIVGIGLVALLSLGFTLSSFVINMLIGMGLALGIDYALFIVSRVREERRRVDDPVEAIARAGNHASRAVLFSGSTFVVAMFGMLIVPTSVMRSLAAGAIIVGIVSVAAALTLLPATLGLLGNRIDTLRVPVLGRNLGRADAAETRFWQRIVARVLRRPAAAFALTSVVLLAAAAPLLGLHVGATGVSTLPNSMTSKQGYLALARALPQRDPYPVQVVAIGGSQPRVLADLTALGQQLSHEPPFGAGQVAVSPGRHIAVLTVALAGDPVGSRAVAGVRALRDRAAPAALAGSGAQLAVGGKTSQSIDYFDAVTNPTPLVLAFVLVVSFVVLLLAFRSLAVAFVSLALNLLSVGAAYGLLTLVFLHGVGAGLLGFQHVHVVEAWVPLFLFSVLFGLSMDYQVFLMSRIKERHDAGDNAREAVARGVASTARIITGAALIIVVVFIGFARGQLVMFQQMGFGVAIALLLDATVVRSVLLPSLLALLGERAWLLPRRLSWLPRIGIEGPAPGPLQERPVVEPSSVSVA